MGSLPPGSQREPRRYLPRDHEPARPRQRGQARARADPEEACRVHQRPFALPLGLSLAGQDRGCRGIPDADQDDARALPCAGGGDPRRASVRTSRDHRGPIGGRPPRLSRVGRFGNPASMTMRPLLVALLLLSAQSVVAAGDDLLEPDKAFRLSGQALDSGTAEVRYRIADGYYLYRDRFRFAAEPASVTLGSPRFPEGEIHEDKFFGKQVTYRG